VTRLQPGIESLSSDVLRIMNKGITALQNVRLLKWARILDVNLVWNLLFGFPRENPDDYARTARLIPLLHHLQPPGGVGQLRLDRFSPFHVRPAELGIEILDALPFYYHLYDVDPATVRELAYYFAYVHADGRDPRAYIGPVREAVSRWKALWHESTPSLTYRRGPDFMTIDDQRQRTRNPVRTTLDGTEAAIYALCESGASVAHLIDRLVLLGWPAPPAADVLAFLQSLAARDLVFEEDGKFLSLALPHDASGYSPESDPMLVGSIANGARRARSDARAVSIG
jgi:hypothetical protein